MSYHGFLCLLQLFFFPADQTMSVYPTGFGTAPSPCVKVRIQKTERGKSPLTVWTLFSCIIYYLDEIEKGSN